MGIFLSALILSHPSRPLPCVTSLLDSRTSDLLELGIAKPTVVAVMASWLLAISKCEEWLYVTWELEGLPLSPGPRSGGLRGWRLCAWRRQRLLSGAPQL